MNSIPCCSYVVKYFTKSPSQSKYRLFCIFFTITISILLLVVSQIGFAQFPYTDAKKYSQIDTEEITAIIDLNNSSLFNDYAAEAGVLTLTVFDIQKLVNIIKFNSSDTPIDLSILKKVGKQLTSIGNSDLLKKLKSNVDQQKNIIFEVPPVITSKNNLSELTQYESVFRKFQLQSSDSVIKSLTLSDLIKFPQYLSTFNLFIEDLQKQREKSIKILEGLKALIGRIVYTSTIDIKNLNSLAEIRELKEEIFGIYNPNSQNLSEINSEIKSTQNISGFSEAALIDAAATFIAEQIKADIVNDIFSNLINDDYKKKFEIIFPKTLQLLYDFKKTNMLLNDMTVSLRKVILEDLKNILLNIRNTNIADINKIFLGKRTVTPFEKELKSKYDFIIDFMQQIVSGTHPIDLFPMISKLIKINPILKDKFTLSEYLLFFDVIQESLRDGNENGMGSVWLNIKKISDLKLNEKEYFLRNILLKIKKANLIQISDTFYELYLKDFSEEKFTSFEKDITGFLTTLSKFENLIKKITKTKNATLIDYETYMESIYEVIVDFNSFYELFSKGSFVDYVESTLTTMKKGIDAYKSISSGNYSSILASSLVLMEDLKLFDTDKKFKRNFVRFTSLFVEIVNAKSTEQMKDAISKASSNSGGFMVKRNSGLHISLNAYGGLTFAREELYDSYGTENVFGITAPIGLEFTMNNPRLGIFASAIDIGAVVSWRFNSKESIPNTITLKQVVSPGVFLRWSPWENSAITLMGGVQWNPELREVIDSNNVSKRKNTFRFGLSLTYDIPILFIL